MDDFEVRLSKFRSDINSLSEQNLVDFETTAQEEINILMEEIASLNENTLSSLDQGWNNSTYNYIQFLQGCIEKIQDETEALRRDVERILINSGC